jgi:hypothetical protein
MPGGVKVSINLDKPLPQKLEGWAGFNLEFLPSIYMGKAYVMDGSKAGIFPRTPNDAMTKVLPLADEPKKAYYLEDWDKAKGYTQPLPFAEGKSIILGVDDALARVNVVSDTADLMLFDGRDRAQNGWFVLRSLIPSVNSWIASKSEVNFPVADIPRSGLPAQKPLPLRRPHIT